ncbi:hypothetical protein [Humibacter ginsenosidimutans]|uniref:Uncharacterized protein n=1 Tax=Humibacter ginsenosidimutans TaxID=2599293 RepID=A0A5B8M2R3_9MICO|nr:hypothetical protein [Humibacter ginsenosidimutans]QDZ14877.1 hypothetical protein FPZ11_08995 [Humibacter ginsenosidimutans]
MARLTNQQLEAELARAQAEKDALEAEKRALAARLDEERSRADAAEAARASAAARAEKDAAGAKGEASTAKKKRGWGWTLLATVLIVIASILAPVAVVSTWAQRELTDTNYFVDTFAPLSTKPAVQDLVVTQTVTAIESNVDIEGITSDVFTGLENLGLGPKASTALNTLQAPLVAGIKSLITQTVTKFVHSEAFSDIWKQTLTITHKQLLATLNGDKNAAISVGPNGQIGVQLGPIIKAVKTQLVDQGFAFAKNIPAIDKTIVIAKTSSVTLYIGLYNLVVAVGIWLPWVVLVLLAAGVLVARRRGIALIWASVALALSMILVSVGISVGKTVFVLEVSSAIPADAAGTLYAGILGFVQSIVVVVAVLAITVFVIAMIGGPFRWARALRGYAGSGFAAVRRGAERHGITTGRVGEWMYAQRILLRVIVGLAAAAVVVFLRPLTPPVIIWTAVIAVLVIAVLELVSRPPAVDASTQEPAPAAAN